jgi:acetyltransferase-like isoleucine patch superfamily enzyme
MRLIRNARGQSVETEFRALVKEGVVSMGRYSYGTPLIRVWRSVDGKRRFGGRVRIGSFVSIARDVEILTGGEHRIDWATTFPLRRILRLEGADRDGHPSSKGDVEIGNDVWIGVGARIMSGVKIGHGAVIGGFSVVTSDVSPYSVVAGNPAREVKRRFKEAQIAALLALAWWDKPIDWIIRAVPLLSSSDIDGLLDFDRNAAE